MTTCSFQLPARISLLLPFSLFWTVQIHSTDDPGNTRGTNKNLRHTTKYVYIRSTTVYVPSSELGLSQPLSRQRVCPSPQNRGGRAHSPAGEGLGESQFRRLEKNLSTLSTLCWTASIITLTTCTFYKSKFYKTGKLTLKKLFVRTSKVVFSDLIFEILGCRGLL